MQVSEYPQAFFPGMSDLSSAVEEMASAGIEERGAIFTKPVVVDFILDLVGYEPNRKLSQWRLLEPSFGNGQFLIAAIERLLDSCDRFDSGDYSVLTDSLVAVELHRSSFESTREKIRSSLSDRGIGRKLSTKLVDSWLVNFDFLLTGFDKPFDFIVGNPPYVRIERVPEILMREYRKRFSTMYDRADLYIPFIERSLDLLVGNGKLSFICADRWIKNRYGAVLRNKIASSFHVEAFIDMNGTEAFESEVSAYPAIVLLSNSTGTNTRIATNPKLDRKTLRSLSNSLTKDKESDAVTNVLRLVDGSAPWIVSSSPSKDLLRALEERFKPLEQMGCKVGIGVATGADAVFIGKYDELDVEPERKVPLVNTRDISSGQVVWSGSGVLNPFAPNGELVDLTCFPKFEKYLLKNKAQLMARHVAKKNPTRWFRTIDRIHSELTTTPKLLIPDIKGVANIALEKGELYPHHNLYYIASTDWDINALRLVLLSGIAHLFVSSYTTKMRGGYLRFQAQHLRRICLPSWSSLKASDQAALTTAKTSEAFDVTVAALGLSTDEASILEPHFRNLNQ